MKKGKISFFGSLFIFGLFITLGLACATNSGKIPDYYSEIVEINGSKEDLYTKANLVLVDLFNNAESVIQYSDKEAGEIKGKYVSNHTFGLSNCTVYSTVNISVKDGKYKISISLADVYTYVYNRRTTVAINDSILEKMNSEWKNLAAHFKNNMTASSSW